jgi:hypothetical protein
MALAKAIFVGNLLATGVLTGIIWYVQIVHYPLFARVGEAGFARYHAAHSALTTRVVALPMLIELALSGLLLFVRPAGMGAAVTWAGFALAVAVWACTFFIAVPLHGALGGGHDAATIARLVATNWLRTVAWTAHLAILTSALVRLLP